MGHVLQASASQIPRALWATPTWPQASCSHLSQDPRAQLLKPGLTFPSLPPYPSLCWGHLEGGKVPTPRVWLPGAKRGSSWEAGLASQAAAQPEIPSGELQRVTAPPSLCSEKYSEGLPHSANHDIARALHTLPATLAGLETPGSNSNFFCHWELPSLENQHTPQLLQG